MELKNERDLLNNVINLRKRYALVDKLSARPFNIFSILRTERNERFTHSAFIAELLNPKGSHCQGDIFLKLFLNEIKFSESFVIEPSKINVKVEQYTGDGFIDIWIDFGDAYICIENKIDAGDQKDQLRRYDNHCSKFKKPYKIIYLSLDGRDSEDAKVEPVFDYLRWSYKEQIMRWLNLCIKETARIPVLRETLYQYQQLLKKLCHMLQNENEASELNELLKKDIDHFTAANNIHEQFKTTKYQVKLAFWKDVEIEFFKIHGESLGIKLHFTERETYPKIIIRHKQLNPCYVCFCVEWLQGNPYFGIYAYGYGDRKAAEIKVIDEYKELRITDIKHPGYWFSKKHYDNIDFSAIETLSQTFSPTEKQNLILQIVKPVDDLIQLYGNRVLEINNEIILKLSKRPT